MDALNHKKSAYLTVFLALLLTALLSLCLALTEGVRSNAVRLEGECVTDIGMNSILAEYHRELLGQYNLFAIDSSYGTKHVAKENVEAHLKAYMDRNFSNEGLFLGNYLYRDFLSLSTEDVQVETLSLMTDGEGAVFRRAAVEAICDDVGLSGLEKVQEWMKEVENCQLLSTDMEEQWQTVENQIEEVDFGVTENPMHKIEQIRREGILKHVVSKEDALSGKVLQPEQLIASRMTQGEISHGNEAVSEQTTWEQLEENFLFREYLLRYMGSYRNPKEAGALSYQIEYLLSGKSADTDNLKHVARLLCGIREVANALYLTSDEEKSKEVELVAAATSALLGVPEAEQVLEAALILGWAYMESLYDVRTLMEGGKIPLIKDRESWHYSLQNALQGGSDPTGGDRGLTYEDYLRILLWCRSNEELAKLGMNMVEADIRLTPGNAAFRLDGCIVSLGVQLRIHSQYGTDVQLQSHKSY